MSFQNQASLQLVGGGRERVSFIIVHKEKFVWKNYTVYVYVVA